MNRDELESIVARMMDDNNTNASEVIDTIFDSMIEPTEEMLTSQFGQSSPRICWQAMLTASPLAPDKN